MMAAALRVAGCAAGLATFLYLHQHFLTDLYILWLPSLAVQLAYKWWRHGGPAALLEASGAAYDFVRPFRACVEKFSTVRGHSTGYSLRRMSPIVVRSTACVEEGPFGPTAFAQIRGRLFEAM